MLSDASWYCLGLGLICLFYAAFYVIGRRIPTPDPKDPRLTGHEQFLAGRKRTVDRLGPPMLWIGGGLIVASAVLFIVSRLT